jgi:hypothetical protein
MIAKNYRKKVAEQINESNISTFDWLTAAGNKESWREGAKQLLQTEEMKECTFRPNTKSSSMSMSQLTGRRSSRATSRDINGADKCSELYMKAEKNFMKNQLKTDRKTQDVEYERQKSECTFKPTIKPLTRQDLNISNYKPDYNRPDDQLLQNPHVIS